MTRAVFTDCKTVSHAGEVELEVVKQGIRAISRHAGERRHPGLSFGSGSYRPSAFAKMHLIDIWNHKLHDLQR
jgi:hypothetical protein